jgi:hypothetical protein
MENKRKMPDPKKVIIKIDDYEFEAGQYILIAKGKKNDDCIHSLSIISSPTTGANMLEELERHSNNIKEELKKYKKNDFEQFLKSIISCDDCPERFDCDDYRKGGN